MMNFRNITYTNFRGETIDFHSDNKIIQNPKGFGFDYDIATINTNKSRKWKGMVAKIRTISFEVKIRGFDLQDIYSKQSFITDTINYDNVIGQSGIIKVTNANRELYSDVICKNIEYSEVVKGALVLKITFDMIEPDFRSNYKRRIEALPQNIEDFGHIYIHPYSHKSGSGQSSDNFWVGGSSISPTKIYIIGECVDPLIVFRSRDVIEEVNVKRHILEGEVLEIDSVNQTMKLTETNGNVVNVLKDRNPKKFNWINLRPDLYYVDFIGSGGKVVIEFEERYATT